MKTSKSKIRTVLTIFFLVVIPLTIYSQASDDKQVENVIIGYISNFFINDYDEMEVYLHDRLSKRGVNQNGKLSPEYPKEELKKLMENKTIFPLKHQRNIVSSIKVYNRVATAILETGYPKTRWKEYIHLAKLDGKWIITDVFWSFDIIKN